MKHTTTQVYSIAPDELVQKIMEGVEKKLGAFEERLGRPKTSKYLSRKEASRKLQVSYVTLNLWDKKGILKKRKIGNKVFYLKEEIENILEASVA